MPRILIISGHHLCHNPRVIKEADALCAAGHEIEVLGAWLDPALAERDEQLMSGRDWKFTPIADYRHSAGQGRSRWVARLRTRLGSECFKRFGWANAYQLGYVAPELLQAARRRSADLTIGHLEQGLWAADRLLAEGFNVGVDIEDWYSADLPSESRRHRPIALLAGLERRLLASASHRTCTSHAMSEALATTYRCEPLTVVYNAFPSSELAKRDGLKLDRQDPRLTSIYWFSQTLGPARGLEDLFAALPKLCRPVEVHLRAAPMQGCQEWLAEQTRNIAPCRVFLHDLVGNDELISRISEHDLGFAGEIPYCQNKDLTVSNKIFHYLLGGLAILASDTRGQRELLEQAPAAGVLYPPGEPQRLADAINSFLVSPEKLTATKAAAAQAAGERFAWEREAAKLVDSVERAVLRCTPARQANPKALSGKHS
jgi:glycosyltransferase involved in cell wall biosynthesis